MPTGLPAISLPRWGGVGTAAPPPAKAPEAAPAAAPTESVQISAGAPPAAAPPAPAEAPAPVAAAPAAANAPAPNLNGVPIHFGAGGALMLGNVTPLDELNKQIANAPKPVDRPVRDAVVLGGGPGGLATAIELRKQGLRVYVLEVRDENYARPHQLNARQATIDSMASYGVEQDVRARSGWDPKVALPGDASRVSTDPQALLKSPSVGQVRISDVEKSLYKEAKDLGVHYLKHVTGVMTTPATDGDHKGMYELTVQQADQKDGHFTPYGKLHSFGYPGLIVVADGANSPTRKQLGITFDAKSDPHTYLGGLVNKSIGGQYKKMVVEENGHPVHVMGTGHAIYPQTWVSGEVDPDHVNMTPQQRVDYLCKEASVVTGQDVKPSDIAFGAGQITTVQNRAASTTVAGDNVVLIGDAARTGSVWASGGLNLALTTDVAEVSKLVQNINTGATTRAQAMQSYNEDTQAATKAWHDAGAGELGGPPQPPAASQRI